VTIIRALLLLFGLLALAMGLLWIGQGTGLVMWPASSFMLADRTWAFNGALLAAVGIAAMVLARRLRR